MAKRALIVGAGPAGLTAALELLRTTDVLPLVVEAEGFVGGISRTAVHNGNRIDIGGHRFFSKSDEVMELWRRILPQQGAPSSDDVRIGRPVALAEGGPDPEKTDRVMLSRSRLSRILFLRKLFDYPVSLNLDTVLRLGPVRMAKIGLSYLKVSLLPKREEKSLEDFMINRFGVELYRTFFRDYTEKVWGVPCSEISPEWGGQRIKGLSVMKTVAHALRQLLPKGGKKDVAQKGVETSLIGNFLYPKLGPGQLWETLADEIRKAGGEIRLERRVVEILRDGDRVTGAVVEGPDGRETIEADFLISSMPVADLVRAMSGVPDEVRRVAEGLVYRDFMTVGLLLDRLELKKNAKKGTPESRLDHVADNWIYVQESDVKLGRIQVFNNWSPYLVSDPSRIWIGLEYFANEGDAMWTMPDDEFVDFAVSELEKIGVAKRESVRDSVLIRVKKAYPAYFGSYGEFGKVREWTDSIENLYLVGRNGMHRYNNMDHSMLSAIEAAKAIRSGSSDKSRIWDVNTEEEHQEISSEKKPAH